MTQLIINNYVHTVYYM